VDLAIDGEATLVWDHDNRQAIDAAVGPVWRAEFPPYGVRVFEVMRNAGPPGPPPPPAVTIPMPALAADGAPSPAVPEALALGDAFNDDGWRDVMAVDFDDADTDAPAWLARLLAAKRWTLAQPQAIRVAAHGDETFLRIGGDTASPAALTMPLPEPMVRGRLTLDLGASVSAAEARVELLAQGDVVAAFELGSRAIRRLVGDAKRSLSRHTNPSLDVATLGTAADPTRRLRLDLVWQAATAPAGHVIAKLTQPRLADDAQALDAVLGPVPLLDGATIAPDAIRIRTLLHDDASRSIALYRLHLQGR